jgi:uncharacterized membrane protein
MHGLFLIVHILGGSVALLAGAGALIVRKGGALHGQVGTLFLGSMLVLAGSGAVMAALAVERGTMIIGILTCYLVITSWATARRRERRRGAFDWLAFAVALGCALAMLSFGMIGVNSAEGKFDSLPGAVHFPFAALAALAAALDLNFMLRRDDPGVRRIARHLWRMCAALLIAAFSFFLGQQKVMPVAVRGSPFLFLPPLATFAAMLFWLLRLRFGKSLKWWARRRGAAIA